MPQFNPESLARVLVQVEREVLVEAVQLADLPILLTDPRGETIDELAEYFNFLSNIAILGRGWLDVGIQELLNDVESPLAAAVKGLKESFGWLLNMDGKLDDLGILIDKINGKIDLALPPPRPTVDEESKRLKLIAHAQSIIAMMDTLGSWNTRHAKSNVVRGVAVNTTWEATQIRNLA